MPVIRPLLRIHRACKLSHPRQDDAPAREPNDRPQPSTLRGNGCSDRRFRGVGWCAHRVRARRVARAPRFVPRRRRLGGSAGRQAGWPPDGKHLAYGLSSDPNHGLEAEIQGGSEFRLGPPHVFATFPQNRGIAPDKAWKRVLALFPAGKDPTRSITVVLNGLPGGRQ
jgi:hypothetical protein